MTNSVWITILGFYTLAMVGGIFYYEDRITILNRELDSLDSDYDEMYGEFIRVNNQELDSDNKILQDQIKALKLENVELKATAGDWQRAFELSKSIQYESSVYKDDTYKIEQTPYTNAYGPNLGYHQDEIDLEQ